MEKQAWTIGESVVVKPGVSDPDTGRDIGSWQGRISLALLRESFALRYLQVGGEPHLLQELLGCSDQATSLRRPPQQSGHEVLILGFREHLGRSVIW